MGDLMVKTKSTIDIERKKIFDELPPSFKQNSFASKIEGITGIAPFSESYPPKVGLSKYRMKIACDILVLEEEKPFLAIELETSQDPQFIMGLIPLYMMTKWIKIRKGDMDLNQFPVESPFLLLIILPNLTDTLREKWFDLEIKLRELLNLKENKVSSLTDFEICELPDYKASLKRLLERNGYESYANEI